MTHFNDKLPVGWLPRLLLSSLIGLFGLSSALGQYARPVFEWDKGYGGNGWEELNSIQQTNDEGFIMVGFSGSNADGDVLNPNNGGGDVWAVKIDQLGNIEWEELYGGDQLDRARVVKQTTDGGYIIGGWSASGISGNKGSTNQGGDDFWVIKINALGGIEWERSFGGTGFDQMYDLIQTSDGGYLLGGNTTSDADGNKLAASKGGQDWWIVKINAAGGYQWDMSYGGSDEERLNEMHEAPDGTFVLAGASASDIGGDVTEPLQGVKDFWMLKVDPINGGIVWERRYGGPDEEEINSFILTSDGGYLLGGATRSDAIPGVKAKNRRNVIDMWVVKTRADGSIEWEDSFAGAGDITTTLTNCYTVKENSIGHYMIGGVSNGDQGFEKSQDSKGGYDYWMIYLAPDGRQLWDITLGGDNPDSMENLFQTSDGGYLLAGHSSTNVNGDKSDPSKGLNDFWIIKTQCILTLDIPDITVCPDQEIELDAYDPLCQSCQWQWNDGNTDSIRSMTFTQSTSFQITLTDGVGCARFDEVNVNVLPRPSLELGPDPEICDGGSETLDAGSADSYLWSTGEQTQTLVVDTVGRYVVTITDGNGCTNADSVDVRFSLPFVVDLGADTSFCSGEDILLDAGNPGFSFQWSPNGSGQTRRVGQVGTYSVTVTDANNCRVADTIQVDVYTAPQVAKIVETCNVDNTAYTVQFEITGGDASSYQVGMGTGTIANGIFTSDPIPRNQAYVFQVSDARNCTPVEVSGRYDCDCSTDAGSLDRTPLMICGTSAFEISIRDNGQLDMNDVRQFILHDGDATSIGTILSFNSVPQFSFLPSMSFGVTYYVTSIAGNDDGTGNVSRTDGCFSTTNGVAVVFNEPPRADLVSQSALMLTCADPTIVLDASASAPLGELDFRWITEDGNFTSSGNQPQAVVDKEGMYQVIVTDQQSGCIDTASIELMSSQDFPEVAIAAPGLLTCIDSVIQLDGSASSAGASISYAWTGPSFLNGTDTLAQSMVNQAGVYTLVVTDMDNGCSRSETVQVQANNQPPVVDAGNGSQLDCIVDSIELDGSYSGTGNAIFSWSTLDGNITLGAQTLQPVVNQAGTYTLMVTDPNTGCSDTDEVIITEDDDVPTGFNLGVVSPVCFGDDNGRLTILGVNGGSAPYLYSLDGQNYYTNETYEKLKAGEYHLWAQDANGCEIDTVFKIEEPDPFVLSLGVNKEIALGESVRLKPQTNVITLDTFYWEITDGINCLDCWSPLVTPTSTTSYVLTAIDDKGCLQRENIIVNVRKDRNIYVPTAFSPNGDGFNDFFTIYADPSVEAIQSFRVFDRWGELVFENKELLPNTELEGWDGFFKGKLMNNGVYIYYAEILFTDGWMEVVSGDVSLVR